VGSGGFFTGIANRLLAYSASVHSAFSNAGSLMGSKFAKCALLLHPN
jgi:hypothetical protein